jgi:hypothetical protein
VCASSGLIYTVVMLKTQVSSNLIDIIVVVSRLAA